MPRVHHVKKARKDNPVAKKGEPYYWWKFRFGGKHYSTKRPKQSQLTQSSFLSQAYELNERIEDLQPDNIDDLRFEVEDIAEQFRALGDECDENLQNMPDHLQDSSEAGNLLQERVDGCSELADELENIDMDVGEEDIETEVKSDLGEDAEKEEITEEVESRVKDKFDEILGEVQALQYEGG